MPHTVKYRPELMESILTAKRLLSYERVFGKLSDRELVGIYVWNQVTGGALYPLLSAAEVTLRNAIDTAFIHFSGKMWWKRLRYKSYLADQSHAVPFDIQAVRDNFIQAGHSVRKEKWRRYQIRNHKPAHEEIVASTDFFSWECLMTSELQGPNLFWGAAITRVFRGVWPASSGTATLSTARKLTKTVREYRNRLAHNEPIWKAYPVSTPAEAVAYISGKIDAIEQLIGLLSPEKLDLLTKHGLFAEARQLNSLAGIAGFSTSPLTRAQATARCGQVTRR